MSDSTQVLLLRATVGSHDKEDKYLKCFEDAKINVHVLATLQFHYLNLELLNEHMLNPINFSGVIFTSQKSLMAVELCMQNHRNLSYRIEQEWSRLPAFCLGYATQQRASELGFNSHKGDCGNSESLAKSIIEYFQPGTENKPLLFPGAENRMKILPQVLQSHSCYITYRIPSLVVTKEQWTQQFTNEISYIVVDVYKSIPRNGLDEAIRQLILSQGIPRCIIFFSPSVFVACINILKEMQAIPPQCSFAAIGPTTEKSIIDHGYNVVCHAEKPDPQSLVRAISTFITAS